MLSSVRRSKGFTSHNLHHCQYHTVKKYHAFTALCWAKHARPMNEILDDDYRAEVDMLCPGTVVPHPTTILWDLINIYVHMSTFVMNYFLVGVIIPSNIYFFGLKNIYSNSTVLFILCLMDGQVLLSHHTWTCYCSACQWKNSLCNSGIYLVCL